jgi:hypothetical protein
MFSTTHIDFADIEAEEQVAAAHRFQFWGETGYPMNVGYLFHRTAEVTIARGVAIRVVAWSPSW